MNKSTLVCEVSKRTKCPLRSVAPIVDAVFAVLADTIVRNEKVSISVLGTFCLKDMPQRVGFNPVHRVPMIIPKRKVLKFEPSIALQIRIREKYDTKPVQEMLLVPAEP